MALRQALSVLRQNIFFLPLARVLKRPIVCSGGVNLASNFGSPDNLSSNLASNFGTP